MYNNIVVGYDESETSKAALKEASSWIKKHGGHIVLVHAVYFDQEEFVILPSQMEQRFAIGTRACLQAKKDLQSEYGLNGSVDSIVCEGEPPEAIVDVAQGKKADLVALGTYGRKGLKRMLMGSVTSQVVLHAPCDVLVVKRPCAQCTGTYRSILLPFDGSESGTRTLRRAAELAKVEGADITVLYVIPRYEEMMEFFKTESIKKSLDQEAEKILGQARNIVDEQGVTVTTVTREGAAGDQIVAVANSMKKDLIVMGSHGWSGVSKAIMGSTTERVIAHSPVPVLVVR
jgi:nucleotide-binding universal stress UspA family protein